MYGVTVEVARASGYTGPMCDMPKATAFKIYERQYWDAVQADELMAIDEALAYEVVDTGINCGTTRAVVFLQTALNALNANATIYPDMQVDGKFGPATLSALKAYVKFRKASVLVVALNCLQGSFYLALTEKRPKDERFIYGWLSNRVAT